jgi:uncharacterized protein (TIGR03437 family)
MKNGICFSVLLLIASIASAQTVVVSAASGDVGLAPSSMGAAYGTNLAGQTAIADMPWPTTLAGIQVQISDRLFVAHSATIRYVSPTQIDFEVPAAVAPGPCSLQILGGVSTITVPITVTAVAPALFSANGDGKGVAAATGIRIVIPTTIQSPVTVFQCGSAPGSCSSVPIDLGVDAPAYLTFYGTGIRRRSSEANVMVKVGSQILPVMYAGPQPQVEGLDQVNVAMPLTLRGLGEVNVAVIVDGVVSNTVRINIQ